MAADDKDDLTLQDFMPAGQSGAEGRFRAGEPLPEGTPVAEKDAIEEALREVYDPEISVNIYDLGLIYELEVFENGDVKIDMTLTSPTCPVAGILPAEVARAAAAVEGVGEVEVQLVWEPQWNKDMMSDDAKLALDLY